MSKKSMTSSAEHSEEGATPDGGAPDETGKKQTRRRLLLLVVILVGLWVLGRQLGLDELATPAAMSEYIKGLGPWGVVVFVGLWTVYVQMQLPGVVFVIAAMLLYGPLQGAVVSWFGGMFVIAVTHVFIRGIGGTPLAESKRAWVRKVLSRIEQHPVRTVAILRSVFVMNPAINYPIILGGMSFRQHMTGSALGLIFPVIFWSIVAGRFGAEYLLSK
ncbi:MAG: hypothetical protein VX475_09040 [Myxococcota bacterium]|jgi:uncharacterized membrane protein YdjX (TVP38/TMEM64 family)|nr:hypothetical protein [Myxococcota bacterium]